MQKRILSTLIRYRYRTMLGVVVLILLLEAFEHLLLLNNGLYAHRVYNAVLYTLFILVLTWMGLTMLAHSERARQQAAANMDLQTELGRRLGEAPTWEALVEGIVTFPQQVAPQVSASLFVYHPTHHQPHLEASCVEGEIKRYPLSAPSRLENGQPWLAPTAQADVPPPISNSYDLRFIRNSHILGLLRVEYPAGSAPGHTELRALNSAAPLISLALEGALLQSLAAEQAAASEADRQQIAQDLHDTLAQNIGYLRLKLDQLTGENAIREIGAVLQELERMRATADEAYAQVRHTLDELVPIHTEDLVTAIVKQARTICDRAALNLRTSQIGVPYALPNPVRQQILYISREALHNVEKHACARQVHLQFLWLEAELIMKISDDGTGFNPLLVPLEGHYGLWIMQQRAGELGGALKISPSDDKGTEVTLWVPRPAFQSVIIEKEKT